MKIPNTEATTDACLSAAGADILETYWEQLDERFHDMRLDAVATVFELRERNQHR